MYILSYFSFMKYIILLLSILASMVALKAQKQVLLLSSDGKAPVVNALITKSEDGSFLGFSDKNGCFQTGQGTKKITISHPSYRSLDVTLPQDTVYLDFAPIQLQEVEVLEKGPRYYRLRSAVRVYQYIDSIPINFVDGVVDFYVDTKRGKLDYKALRLDVYTDDDAIKHSSLQKGIVDMSNNSLVNWLYNEHISSNGELQATDTCVFDTKSGAKVGYWNKYPNGVLNISLNLVNPNEEQERTSFGRTTIIHKKVLEQSFPQGTSPKDIKPYDFQLYRLSIELSTKPKKKMELVFTTKIHEIYVLERKGISEAEYKTIRLDNNWGSLTSSIKQEDGQYMNLPLPQIPQNIEKKLNKQLRLLPYK